MNTILKWRETAQELPQNDRRVLIHSSNSDVPFLIAVRSYGGRWQNNESLRALEPPQRWAYLDETEACLPALTAEGDGDGEYAGVSVGDYDIEFRKDNDTFAANIGKKAHGYVRVLHNEKANHLRVGVYGAGGDAPELFEDWFDYGDLTEGV